jgi:hypothetical protein
MTRRPILGCQFVYVAVLVIRWIYVTPSAMQEILADIGKRSHPGSCALEALANVQEVALGRAELGTGSVTCVARGDQCCLEK